MKVDSSFKKKHLKRSRNFYKLTKDVIKNMERDQKFEVIKKLFDLTSNAQIDVKKNQVSFTDYFNVIEEINIRASDIFNENKIHKKDSMEYIKNLLKIDIYSKITEIKIQKAFKKFLNSKGEEPKKTWCETCEDDYESCGHKRKEIKFLDVVRFFQFSKQYCNHDHYFIVSDFIQNKWVSRKLEEFDILQNIMTE
ncbi:8728_t:CDS:1 [Racocetra fulgida]|uniref:8728_t:CDS:1 n=1 Tax=Racocetra fulgida TaxID=60492 RepID=A0A9N8Z1D8_9GLOM|nr:8728_t:CDS:1 [Racocetra fulgida]